MLIMPWYMNNFFLGEIRVQAERMEQRVLRISVLQMTPGRSIGRGWSIESSQDISPSDDSR